MFIDDNTLENLIYKGSYGDFYLGTKNGSQVKYVILKKGLSQYKEFKKYLISLT